MLKFFVAALLGTSCIVSLPYSVAAKTVHKAAPQVQSDSLGMSLRSPYDPLANIDASNCSATQKIINDLFVGYKEAPVRGSNADSQLTVTSNPVTGTWTLLYKKDAKTLCIIGVGLGTRTQSYNLGKPTSTDGSPSDNQLPGNTAPTPIPLPEPSAPLLPPDPLSHV